MISLAAGIMLIAASIVPTFPFTNYGDVQGVRPTGQMMCSNTVAVLEATNWRIFSTDTRDIFVHYDLAGEPDFVYFIVGYSGAPITVRSALTIAEARVRYPDACAFFVEKDI